jgi:hypothetical protein
LAQQQQEKVKNTTLFATVGIYPTFFSCHTARIKTIFERGKEGSQYDVLADGERGEELNLSFDH